MDTDNEVRRDDEGWRSVTDGVAHQRFRDAIEAEILQRLKERTRYMDKSEVEDIGVRAGLDRTMVTPAFLRLAGSIWAGQILPEEGPPIGVHGPRTEVPSWVGVTFYVEWFQKRGKLATGGTRV